MTLAQADAPQTGRPPLRVGDVVEVRDAAEILATLDERGELDQLPFMPEMAAFCGRRMQVHRVAHKLCDTIARTGMRRMTNAVILEGARCDGSGHGGCETACTLLWREEWLRRVDGSQEAPAADPDPAAGRTLLPLLVANSRREPFPDGAERYSCQATELLRAAPTCLPFHDLGQYVQDVRSGNAGVAFTVRAFLVGLFNRLQHRSEKVLPPRWRFREGMRWGFLKGRVVTGRTPTAVLDLQPGELVRIRSKEEILATVNADLQNRGLGFDEEMSRYCGQVTRVAARVTQCIHEPTGRMLTMKSPCIVLEDNVCAGAYTLSCPREYVPFWREIWLERLGSAPDQGSRA